jgi:hypothetical protein
MRAFLATLIIFAAAGCSSIQLVKLDPPPISATGPPPPAWARVCVLRPHWVSGVVTLAVRDNGRLVGATRGNNYFCYFAGGGWHEVTTAVDDPGALQEPQSILFAAAPGQQLYLHQHLRPFGIWTVEQVDDAKAARMIGRCSYRVIAGSDETPAPPVPLVPGAPAPSPPS